MPLGPPVPQTKFQPPTPVSSWVDRARLTKELIDGGNKRLALIHGPAGYGKSTLAAQWAARLQNQGTLVAWFSLDQDDNNAIWFISHLLESLLKAGSAMDPHLLQLLQERPDDAEKYVIPSIINGVADSGQRTVIALDDWHLITAPRTRAVLERLLDDGPENLHFVITSRTRHGLPLGRLGVRDQLVEIDATLLRFDQRESRQWLMDINRLDITRDDLAALHESTDGWAAALQLTSLSLKGRSDTACLVRKISGRRGAIGEYLAENVLDSLEPEVLEFLLNTSITERTCAELASTLSGVRGGQAMLEEVQARELFLQPLDADGTWYRYHHLFEDYLRERIERDSPDRLPVLHAKAARWYAEHRYFSDAVDHALLAGDVDHAVEVVESSAMLQVEHSQMSTLLALVSKLPEGSISERPRLQMAIAWANCLMHFPEKSRIALDRAERLLGPACGLGTDEQDELRTEALVVRRCLEMYADHIEPTDDLRTTVLESARDLRPWIVSVAANIVTYGHLQTGEYRQALATQEEARRVHDQTTGPFSGVYGRCFAGLAALALLDLDQAEGHLRDAYDLGCRSAGRQSHAAQLASGQLGELLSLRGAFHEAEERLEDSRQLGPHGGVVDFMISTYTTLATVKALRGDQSGAIAAIEDGEDIAQSLTLRRLATRLMATRADLGFPWQPCESAEDDEPHVGRAIQLSAHQATLASSISAGATEAVRLADEILAQAGGRADRLTELRARLSVAETLQMNGDPEGAQRHFRMVAEACQAAGVPGVIHERGERTAQLRQGLTADLASGAWDPEVSAEIGKLVSKTPAPTAVPPPVPLRPESPLDAASVQRTASDASGQTGPVLTEREQEILLLVDRGYSNRQIAQSLFIGVNTVKWYLKNLFTTFGVDNRNQCVALAREHQLLDP